MKLETLLAIRKAHKVWQLTLFSTRARVRTLSRVTFTVGGVAETVARNSLCEARQAEASRERVSTLN